MKWYGLLIVFLPSLLWANGGYERIEAFDNKIKNSLLTTAVVAHGLSCKSVVETRAQGLGETGEGFWTVLCDKGEYYSVRVSNDDTSAIRVEACETVPETRLACATESDSATGSAIGSADVAVE